MAEDQLRTRYRYRHRTLIAGWLAVLLMAPVAACPEDGPFGMTLLFQSAGRSVTVMRFDSDGQRGPVPGYLGGMFPRGGAQMTFMPGDSKRPVPEFVEVEWVLFSAEYQARKENFLRRYPRRADRRSAEAKAEHELIEAEEANFSDWPRYTRRIDLRPILTPDLVAKVRADRRNTNLKLIITFNNENVDITAETEKWR